MQVAQRESLRAPIENNDNTADRDERVNYGRPRVSVPPTDTAEPYRLLAFMAGVVITALVLIAFVGLVGFYDLWF